MSFGCFPGLNSTLVFVAWKLIAEEIPQTPSRSHSSRRVARAVRDAIWCDAAMRATCVQTMSTRAPVPRVPSGRHRNVAPARQVSQIIRDPKRVGGGGFPFEARCETCVCTASGSEPAFTSVDWRSHAFASFCDEALSNPKVAAGLRALEQRHPQIDSNVVLFGFWLAARQNTAAMTRPQVRIAKRVSDRWRLRVSSGLRTVHASLRGPDLTESPAANALAKLVKASLKESIAAERAELFDVAAAWERYSESNESDEHTVLTENDDDTKLKTSTSDGVPTGLTAGDTSRTSTSDGCDEKKHQVLGATKHACLNFKLYAESLGLNLLRNDWVDTRAVFEGCMHLRAGGWDLEGDVCVSPGAVDDEESGEENVSGASQESSSEEASGASELSDDTSSITSNSSEVSGDTSSELTDDTSPITSTLQWRLIRREIDESLVKPRRLAQRAKNARYEAAKKNLTHANKLWKQTTLEHKHARATVKAARHEVHKTRKVVRVEWR